MKTINVAELRKEQRALSARVAAIETVLNAVGELTGQKVKPGRPVGRKHTMSKAGRAKIAAAQRARWAKVKAAKKD